MKQFYVIVSGEYPNLARVEIESLLRLYDSSANVVWHGRAGTISSMYNPIPFLTGRAAYLREGGKIIVRIPRVSDITEDDLRGALSSTSTFYVRSFIANRPRASGQNLSIEIGGLIKRVTHATVSFDAPMMKVRAIDLGEEIVVGEAFEAVVRSAFKKKKGNDRAFFHPSLMRASLARAMCNLAQVMPGDIMLDPFCGGGGILCEGAQLGAKVVGIDVSWNLLQGAKNNLQQSGNQSGTLVQGDSRAIPIKHVDAVVTDPPYGRVSSTRGEIAIHLVERLLDELEIILSKGGKLCICSEKEMLVGDLIQTKGIVEETCVAIRIHKKMIREIRVVSY